MGHGIPVPFGSINCCGPLQRFGDWRFAIPVLFGLALPSTQLGEIAAEVRSVRRSARIDCADTNRCRLLRSGRLERPVAPADANKLEEVGESILQAGWYIVCRILSVVAQ